MSTITDSTSLPIHSDPEVMGGAPVFLGTRVPARTLYDYLADGNSLDEFLDNFPSVRREQALQLLEHSAETLSRSYHRPMMERWGKLEDDGGNSKTWIVLSTFSIGSLRTLPRVWLPFGGWPSLLTQSRVRTSMHSDLLDILRVFSHYKVEYLIIGGYAVAFHARLLLHINPRRKLKNESEDHNLTWRRHRR